MGGEQRAMASAEPDLCPQCADSPTHMSCAESEATPAGEQVLIPGVAPVSSRDLIALRAAKPLASSTPQKPLDIGLFDEAARNQLSLF
jgi:hypothetical protein